MKIQEDYVSFEIAKLLKEKGFDNTCNGYYNQEKLLERVSLCSVKNTLSSPFYFGCIPAPTLQMAMKWLREEKRTSVIIEFDLTKRGYNPYVYQPDYDIDWVVKWRRNIPMKYEEACEVAIKYCLEHLI